MAFALRAFRELHGMEGGEVNASTPVIEASLANVGAEIMDRGKFGGGPGPWGDDLWPGWWGEEPPFHMPVFVLTHHEREPLALSDTTFAFVTAGIESVLAQARTAAAAKDVVIGGGASVINQSLAAGLVDELELHIIPLSAWREITLWSPRFGQAAAVSSSVPRAGSRRCVRARAGARPRPQADARSRAHAPEQAHRT